ncbi:dienelactone hydrolase family protein [Planctomicrobium sp. SH664]|uniref:dienelactone hydrolase family protein n=1 Tax=Planctomicrobium sp. SH664 TaxID=3448125 RepID=UPI003F5C23B6
MHQAEALSRRSFLEGVSLSAAAGGFLLNGSDLTSSKLLAQGTPPAAIKPPNVEEQTVLGEYASWLGNLVPQDRPAAFSLRSGKWTDLEQWRKAARQRTLERLNPVSMGGVPDVRIDSHSEFDGLQVEHLSWQLPGGPRTEAVLLKPAGAKEPLPGILGLHDHGGNKFLGWRKIVIDSDQPWPIQKIHQQRSYEGVAWANEIAKRGYVVLVHDVFPFGSRRIRVADVQQRIRRDAQDPQPDDLDGIVKYNQFAREHEHMIEKSLLCAGTTFPGVFLPEDQRALDVLCARPDVDASRVGCAGLSGGGLRTVYLGGMDDRLRCAIAVGFMSTWQDFLLYKCVNHTWMTYAPLLPNDLDFPEILGLRAPLATMVLSCTEDPLYSPAEMQRADEMLKEVFRRARAPEQYRGLFHAGGHKFDLAMQADAFAWFDQHLKGSA